MSKHHMSPGRRAFAGGLGLALAAPWVRRAAAAAPITLGYTATLGFNGAFIAKDQGFFDRRGVPVELQLITLNSNIPGALMGGSVQLGGPTPTVLIQADDGGLDLLVVCGCSGIDPDNKTDGLLARTGSGISKPADCVGKKIGVPGLNAYFHILVRKWLTDGGVDWRRVNFVEVPFTQSADVLRSGSVDAVATGQPFSQRILKDGIGALVVTDTAIALPGASSIFYAATRDWATAHKDEVAAFRLAIADAVRFQAENPAAARASAGQFIKLPPAVLNSLPLPVLQESVTPAQVQFWVDLMAQQGMITDKPDPAKLIFQ